MFLRKSGKSFVEDFFTCSAGVHVVNGVVVAVFCVRFLTLDLQNVPETGSGFKHGAIRCDVGKQFCITAAAIVIMKVMQQSHVHRVETVF